VVTGRLQGTLDLGGGPVTSVGASDIFVARYAGADGRHLWSRRFGGTATDMGYAIAIDGDGVVVAGFFQEAADLGGGRIAAVLNGVDSFLARYALADGRHVWSRSVGGASDDIAYGVTSDGQGGIVVTGFFRARMLFDTTALLTAGAEDTFVAKLRGVDGQTVWARSFGGTSSERDYDVVVDSRGDVVVAGYFQGALDLGVRRLVSAGGADVFVTKLAGASGTPLWARAMGGLGEDFGFGVAVDGDDDVLVGGRFDGTVDFGGGGRTAAGNGDAFLARYAGPSGAHLESHRFGAAGSTTAITDVVAAGKRAIATGHFASTVDFGGVVLTPTGLADLFVVSLGE
jgi:glucose dehydrogenase